jgi:hypothetical protein
MSDAFSISPISAPLVTPDDSLNNLISADLSFGASPNQALVNSIPVVPQFGSSVTRVYTPPSWLPAVAPIAGGLAGIVNSIANVLNPARQAGAYNAAGEFVPIQGGRNPIASQTSFGATGNVVSGIVGSLLPIIILGGVVWFFVAIFSHNSKKR